MKDDLYVDMFITQEILKHIFVSIHIKITQLLFFSYNSTQQGVYFKATRTGLYNF